MSQGLDQASTRRLINEAAIDAVKTMTSNQKETHFFRIVESALNYPM
jgi:hypothetical protein